ncbi:Brix-domain-containing protein [Durotheca rogersii]|uniref:Brix-domain-containing protein n=1 Tax=Durotheca rogersii TaxID=419775 RepID=UPI00221F010D|nr:Brix-domain-containing protein [Durotheca rogersii]KAI5854080.1 Brix-domain-containing protein [Durotheca rogersii]
MAAVYKSLSKGVNGQKKAAAASHDRDEDNGAAAKTSASKTKQRVLVLSSRGVTYRHRHLLNDLASMLPHGRRDAKFDSKSRLAGLNELAELYNCNNVLFFQARKGTDLYWWQSKVPNGPTVKMHLQNLHTMEELHFTGNALKGSRPILSFDAAFEREPYLRVIKELFLHTFGVPPGARRSKPFVDRVMGFSLADGKIWVRNYQIKETEAAATTTSSSNDAEQRDDSSHSSKGRGSRDPEVSLVEIGPRFVLTPIVIQEGAFGGPIIYENRAFVSPNQVRAELRRGRAARHDSRVENRIGRLARHGELGLRTGVAAVRKKGREGEEERIREELDSRKLFA